MGAFGLTATFMSQELSRGAFSASDASDRRLASPSAEALPYPANLPADLVDCLRCPLTQSPLRWMNGSELEELNAAAQAAAAIHLDGSKVDGTISFALVNADGSLAYRVEDGILLMLPLSAIAMTPEALGRHGKNQRDEKIAIQSFYDQIGWKRNEQGHFEDAVIWEDLRPVSADYLHKCHLRINRHIEPTGNYLLDVASGPVQYAEYLTYSQGYRRRICMDLSIAALREARRKVGDKGVYILGDITNLPLRTDALDAVLSLHTIYHVPQDEQARAFEELYRVLKPGRRGAIVYSFTECFLLRAAAKPARWWRGARHSAPIRLLKRLLGHESKPQLPGANPSRAKGPFYFHAHPLSWFTSRKWSFPLDIVVWRSVNVWFLRTYIHPRRFGKSLLKALYVFEQIFPRFAGRHGPYPMFLLRK